MPMRARENYKHLFRFYPLRVAMFLAMEERAFSVATAVIGSIGALALLGRILGWL